MLAARTTLQEMTGRQRPSAIIRWLEKQRIPYIVGADDWPRVAQAEIDRRLGTPVVSAPEPKLRSWRRA